MKIKLKKFLTLLLVLLSGFSFAQNQTITGAVSDSSGPLPGVTIQKKGSSIGVETDFDGKYSIKANKGDVLVFSFVGMLEQQKVVGESTTINVVMQEDNALDEVIVTGYTAMNKSEITGAAVNVKAESIKELATANVGNALQGKISGVAVSGNSGTPGAVATIRIRGGSSINASNDPLYVIDGVPVNNSDVSGSSSSSSLSAIAAIDSNNIESMTILKDAAATAKYGARGSNGVILITTKSGKSGKTRFTFSSSFAIQNDAVTGPVPLTVEQRLMLHAEALFNDGKHSSIEKAEAALLAGTFKDWNEAGRREARWDQVLMNKNAPMQNYNFSASGGGEDHTFFASLGYLKQEGTVIGVDFERVNGAVNFSKNLSEKMTFSSNNIASHIKQDAFLEKSAFFGSPRTARFFLSPLTYPYNEDGTPAEITGSIPNPLITTDKDTNKTLFTRILSNNNFEWNVLEGLTFGSRLNIDYQIRNRRRYSNKEYGPAVPNNGESTQSYTNEVTYLLQNYVDYIWKIDDSHEIDFKLLHEYQTNRRYFMSATGQNFADDNLPNLISAGKPTDIRSSFSDWYMSAYLATVHYAGFNGKYVADFTLRREGNSRFHKDHRWGNFWSIGGAWNIHKEDFFSNVDFINNLKLRASYGVTGNSGIQLNEYQSLLGTFNNDGVKFSYNQNGSLALSTFGNNQLSWETLNSVDLALEFGVLNNRISGTFGYFNKTTNDLLLRVPLSRTTGFTSQFMNIGSLVNHGFEADINFSIVESEDFNLHLGGNIATLRNEVTKLAKDAEGEEINPTTNHTRIETGQQQREFYMATWAGVNPQTGLEEWYVNGKDGERTSDFGKAKRVFQGANELPTLTAGMNLHVDYKGVYLDVSGYYAGGHKIYEGWHRYLNETNGFAINTFNGFSSLLDRWQKPGDQGVRNSKVTTKGNPWQSHSKFLHEGDFFRLRAVTLGYDLPSEVVEKAGLSGVKLYLRGNNLYTWQRAKHFLYDPEATVAYDPNTTSNSSGQTGLETPATKTVSLGLTINF